MDMRIRLPELLEERGLTAYEVSKRSAGRINPSTLYRLTRARGKVDLFSAEVLEALCDVLGVGPGELLEREAPAKRKGRA